MARAKIPDPLERRHLIERDLDPTQALAIAEAYLSEERDIEAIAFLAKADAPDRLVALAERAADQGDAFLLRAACDALGTDPGSERWSRTLEAAAAAGKDLYSRKAGRQVTAGGSSTENSGSD